MFQGRIDPRKLSPRTLVLAGSIGIALLTLSVFVEVRIVVVTPDFGEVTGLVHFVWQISIGLATIGSFLFAIDNARRGESSPEGPARHFEIKGRNHDIDVHLHGIGSSEQEDDENRAENDDSSPKGAERGRTQGRERQSEASREEAVDEKEKDID